jgi:hypothetical protein
MRIDFESLPVGKSEMGKKQWIRACPTKRQKQIYTRFSMAPVDIGLNCSI